MNIQHIYLWIKGQSFRKFQTDIGGRGRGEEKWNIVLYISVTEPLRTSFQPLFTCRGPHCHCSFVSFCPSPTLSVSFLRLYAHTEDPRGPWLTKSDLYHLLYFRILPPTLKKGDLTINYPLG